MSKYVDNDVYTTIEAAKILGVGVRTVQLWMDGGRLDGWKTNGGHRRVLRASVDRLRVEQPESTMPQSSMVDVRQLAEPVSAQQRLKVLVVEDSNHLLRLYHIKLMSWGLPLDIYTAGDGFHGLMAIGEHEPHLLITDLRMPGVDGFDMIRMLRIEPRRQEMKIVVVTGLDSEDINKQGGLPADVVVLTKPVPFLQLEQIVRNQAEQRGIPMDVVPMSLPA